ncbi:MAG: DUF3526 domain-containing protein [Rubrivivax sp.]|nr:DUF3526 domain-containing protein [Rubrivivax sp.]
MALKEWRDLARDARWRWPFAATLLLMLAALVLGRQQAHALAHEHQHAMAADHALWTAQSAKNPHAAAHFGQYAFKPSGPLAMAEPGIDAFVGRAIWLEAHKQNEAQFRAARDGTLSARMGQLQLGFVLQVVLPLVALLLGFSAVAVEREQGTLRSLLSLGASPVQLLLGKALAHGAVLLALVLLAAAGLLLGAGTGAEGGTAGNTLGPQALLRIGAWLGLHALYALTLLLAAMAVAAVLPQPRLALMLLLGFWLINSFLAPRWVSDVLRATDPLPTAQAFRAAIAQDKKKLFGHDEKHPGFIAFRDRVLQQYGVARVEDLPVSFRGLSLREDDHAGYRLFDLHFGRLWAQIEAQDARRASFGWVFPMLAVQPLSMALAGTDNRHQHHFVRQAEAHRRFIQDSLSQDLIDHARPGDNAYVADPQLWKRIPPLRYQAPDVSWSMDAHRGPALALLGWWLLALLALLAAARRWQA